MPNFHQDFQLSQKINDTFRAFLPDGQGRKEKVEGIPHATLKTYRKVWLTKVEFEDLQELFILVIKEK